MPVTCAVTVPSQALVGDLGAPPLAGTVALAAGLWVASHLLWRMGLRPYSGASA